MSLVGRLLYLTGQFPIGTLPLTCFSGFGAQLASSVSPEMIRSWASSCNRGAFVVSALLKVRGQVADKVVDMLTPLLPALSGSSLKGHQAILNELDKLSQTAS